MMTMAITVLVVSGALMIGAVWGIYGRLRPGLEGFLIAMAGGALLVSLVTELVEPSIEESALSVALAALAAGAIVFALVDYWIDEKVGAGSGGGLLAAITLDGVPENLALGVALIGAGAPEVAALAGSIFLSNLPEAAGGAREMKEGRSKAAVLGLWAATAALLSGAAIAGNLMLGGASPHLLAAIRCFAAGAVVASLATEVFPKAYREDRNWAGIATALAVALAFGLDSLAA